MLSHIEKLNEVISSALSNSLGLYRAIEVFFLSRVPRTPLRGIYLLFIDTLSPFSLYALINDDFDKIIDSFGTNNYIRPNYSRCMKI